MKFQFDIRLDDKDYLEYNLFWMLRSHYGKRHTVMMRTVVAVLCVVFMLFVLCRGQFTADSFLAILPMAIFLLLFEVLFSAFYGWVLKAHLRSLKTKGKMGFSPLSSITFYDDRFVEITTDNKTEQTYAAIERISVVDHTVLYIHVNNLMSYIVPFSCFESDEQREAFLAFLQSKGAVMDVFSR